MSSAEGLSLFVDEKYSDLYLFNETHFKPGSVSLRIVSQDKIQVCQKFAVKQIRGVRNLTNYSQCNGSFTRHRTRTGTGTGKRWVSILRYVLYTLHRDRDREPLLPPANEVWGKAMFLHLCVIPFTGGGGSLSQHASQVTWQGGLCPGGFSVQAGLCLGGLDRAPPPHMVMSGRYTSYFNAFLFSIVPVPVPCSVYEPLLWI